MVVIQHLRKPSTAESQITLMKSTSEMSYRIFVSILLLHCLFIYILFTVGNLIREDVSAIEMLQDNAKTIGTVLGAEEVFFSKKKGKGKLIENEDDEELFYDEKTLLIQDLSFGEIEKTKLGRALKRTLEKLETRIVQL